jgi:hypothetical protein
MKTSKVITGALVVLGFGGVVGLASSCGANRAQKSLPSENAPAADTVVVRDGEVPVMVMYGVRPVQFDPAKPIILKKVE